MLFKLSRFFKTLRSTGYYDVLDPFPRFGSVYRLGNLVVTYTSGPSTAVFCQNVMWQWNVVKS